MAESSEDDRKRGGSLPELSGQLIGWLVLQDPVLCDEKYNFFYFINRKIIQPINTLKISCFKLI